MSRTPNPSTRLLNINNALNRASIGLCGMLLLGLSVIIVVDVVYRFFSGRPLVGIYEISQLILLATIFFAFGYVEHARKHITIDILPNMVSRRPKYLLDIIDALCCLVVFSIIFFTSAIDALEAYQFSFGSSGMLQIPLVIPMLIICVGSMMMILALIVKLLCAVIGLGRPGHAHLSG